MAIWRRSGSGNYVPLLFSAEAIEKAAQTVIELLPAD
jgi:hypothetical protein